MSESTSSLNHTSDPSFVLNNNNNTFQPSTGTGTDVGTGASAGAVAAIALPSAITSNINAATVNNTLNSAASAAFSNPQPEPIDFSPVTQLTVGEWVVVGTIFLMLVLVTVVILWHVWEQYRRRRVEKEAVLRELNGIEKNEEGGKTRGACWETVNWDKVDVDEFADVNVRAAAAESWLSGGAERYAYRLSHALEMIRHK